MQGQLFQFVYLILAIVGLVMVANRLKIAYPIVLVLGGLLLSFTARFPKIVIDPHIMFFVFLPPLLYQAAWETSWKEFWRWRRVITSLAFPIVIITATIIAFTSTAIIPGFTLALGFLLGGIISPPDAISATTIMRQVQAPRSLVSIAEGESLLNDASSLIIFRFAVAAVITGQFNFGEAAGSFVLVIIMGALIGIAIGYLFYFIHRYLPTSPSMDIVLTLITPYSMYYVAETMHFSGVLAVVCGGLLLSGKRQTILSYRSRIEATNVWMSMVFVMNGLVFLLIGLQLPYIVDQLGAISLNAAIGYGLAVSGILIATRFVCSFGSVLFTRFAAKFITVADPNPGWKAPVILGWAGMRGVVSLAAAMSIPLVVAGGEAFPFRDLILFITFVVILITLVVQGLTLPWLMRQIKIDDKFSTIPENKQELIIQRELARRSLHYLEEKNGSDCYTNENLANLHDRLRIDVRLLRLEMTEREIEEEKTIKKYQEAYLDLLNFQRNLLKEINQRAEFDEDLIRKYMTLVDVEEYKLRERIGVRGGLR
ncbi:Na+/H+ antiporter [Polluticoccus soli]|uniref:Na+/H+ antiporter n=1 Tax=Polluticoccus soli TaxID=3034150 RepID=UPI0023E34BA7|nr:Na+/H+ antiporter [Flavipsychrobacter sp. JY13-12]